MTRAASLERPRTGVGVLYHLLKTYDHHKLCTLTPVEESDIEQPGLDSLEFGSHCHIIQDRRVYITFITSNLNDGMTRAALE